MLVVLKEQDHVDQELNPETGRVKFNFTETETLAANRESKNENTIYNNNKNKMS